jgi:hypothetical protein
VHGGRRRTSRRRVLTMPAAIRNALARARTAEGGFTLVELLAATVASLFVAGAGMTLLILAVHSEPEARERVSQIQQGRVMIERISRELRQGESVSGASPSSLEILTYVHSATCGGPFSSTARLCRVTYTCTSAACSRTERNADGTGFGTTRQVVAGITGPSVFSYSPTTVDPNYVAVGLVYPAEGGGEGVTLLDGVALRNYQVSDT